MKFLKLLPIIGLALSTTAIANGQPKHDIRYYLDRGYKIISTTQSNDGGTPIFTQYIEQNGDVKICITFLGTFDSISDFNKFSHCVSLSSEKPIDQ